MADCENPTTGDRLKTHFHECMPLFIAHLITQRNKQRHTFTNVCRCLLRWVMRCA